MVRKSVVEGMFYESSLEELDKQITSCFTSSFGPGQTPLERRDRKVLGVLCPHSFYQLSGMCQAFSYKAIGESAIPSVYVILGSSHAGYSENAVCMEDFETVFGNVSIDQEFADNLLRKGVVKEDTYPHIREHSIETQLPFLQFVNKDSPMKIVPIIVGKDGESLGKAIAQAAVQLDRKIVVIASSDLTHYGIRHAFLPFKENVKGNLAAFDKELIQFIEDLDCEGFDIYLNEKKIPVCGKEVIKALLVSCKELGASSGDLESYYSSGEISGDWSNVVTFASVIIQ